MNSDRKLDVLFVNPNSSKAVYQGLSDDYAAREVPVWSLLLAQSCRFVGWGVGILDCLAEQLTEDQAVSKIKEYNPRLVCFVTYSSEPNGGTKNFGGTVSLAKKLKAAYPEYKTCSVGTHTSALPMEVLAEGCFDFVLPNEGVYGLRGLLATDLKTGLRDVQGIGYKNEEDTRLNHIGPIVPQIRMDLDMPGYAWDLLPKREKPLDLYRVHFWHGQYQQDKRSPGAAMYTSLGCPYKCQFCCINAVNRTDSREGVTSADSAKFRYWTSSHILKQIDWLAENGVKNLRLSDEMFFLMKNHYFPLLFKIKEKYGNHFNMWAYARVDSIKPEQLSLFKQSGVNWLCIGIESGDQEIRREVQKGSYKEVNIRQVVKEVEDAGIEVIANYIFGLPEDNLASMEKTYQLSEELNTAMWNAYPCMAIPPSPLYYEAKKSGWELPDSYSGYSFHSWDCLPLPTKYVSAAEVLKFRDEAFQRYWSRSEFLNMICRKFGPDAVRGIENMLKIKLKRKLLGDPQPN